MNEKINELLDEEIVTILEELSSTNVERDEYILILKRLEMLHKLKMDQMKANNECIDKEHKHDLDIKRHELDLASLELKDREFNHNVKALESEQRSKKRQFIGQQFDNYLKRGIEIAGVVVPLIFYASWMAAGFEFEKEGTFTSSTFKGLIQKFKPTK